MYCKYFTFSVFETTANSRTLLWTAFSYVFFLWNNIKFDLETLYNTHTKNAEDNKNGDNQYTTNNFHTTVYITKQYDVWVFKLKLKYDVRQL